MLINTPETKRLVDDYDFQFVSGSVLPVTIDKSQGDTIEINTDGVIIKLAAKPSQTDPEKILPPENITIFARHLLCIQHRVREIVELSPEQKLEWTQAMKGPNQVH